jgi:outer membrane protein OmpA-like peptidoglycan-associated protein
MRFPLILSSIASLALAGCAIEAGSQIDEGGFGNPTMNNTMLMSGEISPTMMMGTRFANEVTPTITFPFDSAQLTPQAQATLRQQADWIKQFPEVRFRVYGHTDLVGSAEYNKALGLRRANAAVSFLVSQGISRSRLEAVVSFGKTQPVVPVPGPEVRNRRTVTEVSGFVQGRAAPLNGKYAEVIFREYVAGAVPPHPQNTVVVTQTNPADN